MRKIIHPILVVAAASFAATSCILDERFNADQIMNADLSMNLFQKGIELPIGSTDRLTLGDLTALAGADLDFFDQDSDGNYFLSYTDDIDLSEQIRNFGLDSFSSLDGVNFEESFDYSLAIDKDALKIDAKNWSENAEIGFPGLSMPVFSPIFANENISMGLYNRYVDNFSISDDLKDIHCSTKIFSYQQTASVKSLLASTPSNANVPLGPKDPVKIEPVTSNVCIDHKINGVEEINGIKLSEKSSVTVSLSISNNFLVSGDVIPNIDVDLTKVLKLKGLEGIVLNISDLALNEKNGYATTKTYNVAKLAKDSFKEGRVYINEQLKLNGQIEADELVVNPALAAASMEQGGMTLDYHIHFEDIDIESCEVVLSPISVTTEEFKTPVKLDATLPSMVDRIESVSFDQSRKAVVSITEENVRKINGLDLNVDEVTIVFPSSFHLEGYPTNVVKVAGKLPIRKEFTISSIDMPSPRNGKQTIDDNVTVKAKVTASGTINSADIPATLSNDVVINASVDYSPVISDYTVKTRDYSHEVSFEKTLDVNVDGLGDLGCCTIIPDGSPVITIDLATPSSNLVSDGLAIALPESIVVASEKLANGLAYSNNNIKVEGAIPSQILLPVKEFKLDASAENNMKFSVNGAVKLPAGKLARNEVETLVNGSLGISVNIPEMKAKNVTLGKDLTVKVDEVSEVTIIAKESLPEMVNYISEITLDNVMLNCSVDVAGLPKTNADYVIDAVATLPDCIIPSAVELKGIIKNGKFTAAPVPVRAIRGIDLSSPEDILGNIAIKGTISAACPDLDINTLQDVKATVKASISDKSGKIAISSIKGRCSYDLDYSTSMAIDVPDFLRSENTCLDVKDPQLLLEINSNIGVPLDAVLEITPWRNGRSEGSAITIRDIKLPCSSDASRTETTKLSLGGDALSRIFRNMPDSLQLSIKAGVNAEEDCIIDPKADYAIDAKLDFNMPLAAGEEFKITLSDTLALDRQVIDVLMASPIEFVIDAENTIPLGLVLYLEFLDAEDNLIYVTEQEVAAKINAGSRDSASKTHCEALVKAKDGAPVEKIEKILLSFALNGTPSYEALSSADYISAKLKAVLPEGIKFDPGK